MSLIDLVSDAPGIIGPSSSYDNVIARFNGTSGYVLQNSSIYIDDNGQLSIGSSSASAMADIVCRAANVVGLEINGAENQSSPFLEINSYGGSNGDLVKITSGGKIQTTSGFRSVAKEYSDAYVGWKYNGDTPEHSNQTGSFDYTGGTYDRLFTATVGVFTQDDEDNHNWIVIKSGDYKGAKAEIETYISSTEVIVRGMGWVGDISSATFDIVPHPVIIIGDGCNIGFCVGNEGNFNIHSKSFEGVGDNKCIQSLEADFGADDGNGFCIHVNNEGYNHIDAFGIEQNVGDLQIGDVSHTIHISIDDSEASSADSTTDIDAISIETTDASNATKHAIHVSVGFDSALFVSGAVAVDPDYGYEVTSGVVVDRVNSGGAGDDAFINPVVDQQLLDNDNDYYLIGSDNTFEVIRAVFSTPGNQDAILEFYYSKAGGGWTQFFPSDGTNGNTTSGNISFPAPGDWTKDDEAEVNGDITNAYYIKIVRTRNNLVTPPTESYFKTYSSLESGMKIRGDGTIQPASLADASASNDSIYYSTTQSKLVYKNSGGVVNDLY